jgi:hypothetical protein
VVPRRLDRLSVGIPLHLYRRSASGDAGRALPVATTGYDLLPAIGTSDGVAFVLTPIQKVILVALAVFTFGTIMMRVVVIEASARRFGVFGHAMIAGMLVLGLAVVALYSLPSSGGLLK